MPIKILKTKFWWKINQYWGDLYWELKIKAPLSAGTSILNKWVDNVKCGYKKVTSKVKCGTKTVINWAKCGTKSVVSKAKCGSKTITNWAKCWWNIISSVLWWKKPKKCKVAKKCRVAKKCKVTKYCNKKSNKKICKKDTNITLGDVKWKLYLYLDWKIKEWKIDGDMYWEIKGEYCVWKSCKWLNEKFDSIKLWKKLKWCFSTKSVPAFSKIFKWGG